MSENLTARQPARFFQKELAPEEPPSLATMQALYSFATPLLAREPWNLLNEGQLILFDDEGSGERCFCSVLGALGEVFAVHVYRGTDSYRCFEKAQSGETMTIDNFFAPQRTVF